MTAPQVVSIAADRSGDYIAVDALGRLWRGKTVRGQRGDYIKWERVEHEFPTEVS
jgi:hypothetical protein